MNKINDRKILFMGTFLLPRNEPLHLEVPVDTDILPVKVEFNEAELDDKSPASWKTIDGEFQLTFHGFKESLGLRIIQSPIGIGSVGDEPLSFMASIHRHHHAYQIHIQFMSGGSCL